MTKIIYTASLSWYSLVLLCHYCYSTDVSKHNSLRKNQQDDEKVELFWDTEFAGSDLIALYKLINVK